MNTHPLLLAGLALAGLTACDLEHRPPIIPEPAMPYTVQELPMVHQVGGSMEIMPAQELSLFDAQDEALSAAYLERHLWPSRFVQPEEGQQVALLSTIGGPDTILLAASEQQPGELKVIRAGLCGLASLPMAVQMHQAWLLNQAQTSVKLSSQQDCYQKVELQKIDLPVRGRNTASGLNPMQPLLFNNQRELHEFFTLHNMDDEQLSSELIDFDQYQLMLLPSYVSGDMESSYAVHQRHFPASAITLIELEVTHKRRPRNPERPCSLRMMPIWLSGYWLLLDKNHEIQFRGTEKEDFC